MRSAIERMVCVPPLQINLEMEGSCVDSFSRYPAPAIEAVKYEQRNWRDNRPPAVPSEYMGQPTEELEVKWEELENRKSNVGKPRITNDTAPASLFPGESLRSS